MTTWIRMACCTSALALLVSCQEGGDDDALSDDDVSGDDDASAADDDTGDDDSAAGETLALDLRPDPGLDLPVWLAVQDGEGPWQTMDVAGGEPEVTISDPDGRYAVAVVCASVLGETRMLFVAATLDELDAPMIPCSFRQHEFTTTVTGTLSGLEPGDTGWVSVGSVQATVASGSPDFSVEADPGTYEMMASRHSVAAGVDRMIRVPSVVVPAEGTSRDLDFVSEGEATAQYTLTLAGAQGANGLANVRFASHTGGYNMTGLGLLQESEVVPFGTPEPAGLDPADVVAVDLSAWVTSSYYEAVGLAPPGEDLAFPFPGPGKNGSITASGDHVTFDLEWELQDDEPYLYFYRIYEGSSRELSAAVSPARAGGTPAWSTPDLNGLPGWEPSWQFTGTVAPGVFFGAALPASEPQARSPEEMQLATLGAFLSAGFCHCSATFGITALFDVTSPMMVFYSMKSKDGFY